MVEDDFLIRMTLAEVLSDEGYEVVEAESGDDAIKLLNPSIALLLTDLQLPGILNGRALVAQARETLPDLPVIYTSGRADVMKTPGRRAMAIVKPYQSIEICEAVRRMLAA